MKKRKIIITSILSIFIVLGVISILIWNGIILLNNPSSKKYPVRGVDVSSYQGDINWDVLASNGISFAFIKATEGSSHVDKYFSYNYSQAQNTNLRVGAYHFFSYDSPGATQAENFINTVDKIENMLPPVIDLEFYGDNEKNPPKRADVEKQLKDMLHKLEAHYDMKPIIYATEKSYDLFLSNDYSEYDIWIRDVVFSPRLSDERSWTFWQYTNRARLNGYVGKEKYIDMNVFNGTVEEFESYAK